MEGQRWSVAGKFEWVWGVIWPSGSVWGQLSLCCCAQAESGYCAGSGDGSATVDNEKFAISVEILLLLRKAFPR